jgi:hypothetical protein
MCLLYESSFGARTRGRRLVARGPGSARFLRVVARPRGVYV